MLALVKLKRAKNHLRVPNYHITTVAQSGGNRWTLLAWGKQLDILPVMEQIQHNFDRKIEMFECPTLMYNVKYSIAPYW